MKTCGATLAGADLSGIDLNKQSVIQGVVVAEGSGDGVTVGGVLDAGVVLSVGVTDPTSGATPPPPPPQATSSWQMTNKASAPKIFFIDIFLLPKQRYYAAWADKPNGHQIWAPQPRLSNGPALLPKHHDELQRSSDLLPKFKHPGRPVPNLTRALCNLACLRGST